MPKLLKILGTFLVLISVSSNIISEAVTSTSTNMSSSSQSSSSQSSSTTSSSSLISSTSSINSSTISSLSSIQSTLAEKLPNGKKQLKKKLSLEYTHPKFETELTDQQKSSILTSLKKWKLDLPVNNAFTVTSIADLTKNESQLTSLVSSTVPNGNKKTVSSIPKTPIKKEAQQKVVYMWASTPNPNWDKNKPFNTEDYESGDPRFVRTEFNVLLKKSKNGTWKATLEQDNELKAELQDIAESEVTTEEKNVLFGANKSENNYTDKIEVLLESTDLSSNLDSVISLNSTTNSIQNLVPVSQQSNSSSSKTIGLLDIFLKSPKVSAVWEDEYSWPWKSGDSWTVGTKGWHNYSEFGLSGSALDMMPPCSPNCDAVNIPVIAPVSGTVNRACDDVNNSFIVIKNMGILHLDNTNLASNGVTVKKGDWIGNVQTKNNGYFGDPRPAGSWCGTSYGAHLHLKMLANPITIDSQSLSQSTIYTGQSFTSQNLKPKPPIVDGTMDRVQPPVAAWYKALDSNCSLNSIVVIKQRDNGDCQKMKYDYGTNSLRNPFGQCIDAGNSNGNGKLVFYSCNNSANQKWFHEPGDGRIWSQQKDNSNRYRCIEYSGLNDNDEVYTSPCGSDSRQRWFNYDLGIQQAPVPNTQVAAYNNYTQEIWPADNGGFKLDVNGANPLDGTPVKLWSSNGSIAQKWGYDWNTHQLKGLNDKCLDAGDINDSNNRWLRLSTCHSGSNQKWFIDNINRIHSEAKTSLCIDSPWGNSVGSLLYMGTCHNGNNQKWSGNVNMLRQETFYPVFSAYNQRFGFDIYGGNNSNQTQIKMWGLGNNQWNEIFEYNSTTQELKNIYGKCVDGGNINDPNNRWIRINDCNNGNQQKWYTDSSYRIHSSGNGLCIDSYGGDNYDSVLYLGGCHNGNNQKWWIKGWLS
jgi:murein DD-endopeptidase MepM/ murein hydrolase activator NlpD